MRASGEDGPVMAAAVRLLLPLEGAVEAPVLAWDAPLSFWGGLDPATGRIVDRDHPGRGTSVSGAILCLLSGRGSSSSSSTLAEALRRGTGPAAVVLGRADPVIVTGALVAQELYGVVCPVGVASDWGDLATTAHGRAGRLRPVAGRGEHAELELAGRGDPVASMA